MRVLRFRSCRSWFALFVAGALPLKLSTAALPVQIVAAPALFSYARFGLGGITSSEWNPPIRLIQLGVNSSDALKLRIRTFQLDASVASQRSTQVDAAAVVAQ